MRIDILTIFPEFFVPLDFSIIKKAKLSGKVEIHIHNLRDYTHDAHKTVDDAPYGGGSGMVMKPDILCEAVTDIKKMNPCGKVIFMSPQGKVLTQDKCIELSESKGFILVTAHYEGVDERFVELICDEEISIGDYVLTGGEIPAMVLTDAVVRQIPGVIDSESLAQDSFMNGLLLDYPHYTRPPVFNGLEAPKVLLSGNHAEIAKWRKLQKIKNTFFKRPELLEKVTLDEDGKNFLKAIADFSDL